VATKSQVSANKANAAKSTGPRSAAGRMKSSHNAFRHGLAVSIASLQEIQADIDRLAACIERDAAGTISKEAARMAAEAQLDLVRIHHVRTSLWRTRFDNADQFFFIDEWEDQFNALERYERRARARRKKALLGRPYSVSSGLFDTTNS
jgi:uncharacterized small protein (DUF1192 family)